MVVLWFLLQSVMSCETIVDETLCGNVLLGWFRPGYLRGTGDPEHALPFTRIPPWSPSPQQQSLMTCEQRKLTSILSMASTAVFLCHAGEQKRIFVDYLFHALREEGVAAFMDEESLQLGNCASKQIFERLGTAKVGAPPLLHILLGTSALQAPITAYTPGNFSSASLCASPAGWQQLNMRLHVPAVVVVLSPEFARKKYPHEGAVFSP